MMKKKIVLVITAVSLCAAMVFGGTLAFLTSHTETLENIMKFDSGGEGSDSAVYIEIAEPAWYGGKTYQWDDDVRATVPVNNKDGLWGAAQPFYDTALIDKDPVVANNSNVAAYVGVEITLPKTIKAEDGTMHSLTWKEFDTIVQFFYSTDGHDTYNDADHDHTLSLSDAKTGYLGELWGPEPRNKFGFNYWAFVKEENFDPDNPETTASKRWYVYARSLDGKGTEKNLQEDRYSNTPRKNTNMTTRLFELLRVAPWASQTKFLDGRTYKLATPIPNPDFDPTKAVHETTNPKTISETGNIFHVLRDNSADPTGQGNIMGTDTNNGFISAMQLNIRAYATQARLETDLNGFAYAAKWNNEAKDDLMENPPPPPDTKLPMGFIAPADGYDSLADLESGGPLYALNIAFPGVFQ